MNTQGRLPRFVAYRTVLERSDGLTGEALLHQLDFNARFVTACRIEAARRTLPDPWNTAKAA